MRYTKSFLKLGIIEPKECLVCGYGISKSIKDGYIRTHMYVHECPLCDYLAESNTIIAKNTEVKIIDNEGRHIRIL